MTGSFWWDLLLSIIGALLVAWIALIVVLVIVRPRKGLLREAIRLLPDVLRLIRRLGADKTQPRGVRVRLVLLLVYLASPIDLIPDFIPVLGYADDAIIVTAVLRSVVRRAGLDTVRSHWPGTDDGFAALTRLTGLAAASRAHDGDAPDLPARSRQVLLRRGRLLEVATLAWNVVGVIVLAVAAIGAHSVALAGFGLDSLIEIGASTVVLWELSGTGETRQRRALTLIGAAFLALAAYLTVQTVVVLATGYHAQSSVLGIVWTAVTAAAMFALAAGKTRTGRQLGNPVLLTEGRVTIIDGVLAVAVLVGLASNALFGWWWADPVSGLVVIYYALTEAHSIFTDHSG